MAEAVADGAAIQPVATRCSMELKQAIFGRRAVRAFTSENVDDNALRTLIDAAVQAPSAVNAQPWMFCVVRDRAILDEISRKAKSFNLATTPAGLLSHHFEQLLSDPQFDIFYHAPVLIIVCSERHSPWAVEDCALAAQNLMLSAYAGALGTCWIGFAQKWLETPEAKSLLQLPPECQPVAPIIVGHPRGAVAPVLRKMPEIRWIGA